MLGAQRGSVACFVLDWPRADLHRRIEYRVDIMFKAGLVDEVRALLEQYASLSKTALQAVGYREVIEHIEGRHSLEEAVELVKMHTRRFARPTGHNGSAAYRSAASSKCEPIESLAMWRTRSRRFAGGEPTSSRSESRRFVSTGTILGGRTSKPRKLSPTEYAIAALHQAPGTRRVPNATSTTATGRKSRT